MYLDKKLFNKKVVLINRDVQDQIEALKTIAAELQSKGVVNSRFLPAIIERERKYPTGLALSSGIGVAIPHTDPDKVQEEQIGFISLKEPVVFKQMGDLDTNVDVTAIFVLCLKSPDDQLQMLQNLMTMFADAKVMKQIYGAKTVDEFLDIFD